MRADIIIRDDYNIRLVPENDEDRELLRKFPYPIERIAAGWFSDESVLISVTPGGK